VTAVGLPAAGGAVRRTHDSTAHAAAFVLACLRNDTERVRALLPEDADINAIVDFAYRHEVVNWVLRSLLEIPDLAPEYLTEAMAFYVGNVQSYNRNLLHLSKFIAEEFSRQSCEVMFAKGVIFNILIHDGDQSRLSKDIDIYVRQPNVYVAYDILRKIGFTSEFYPLDDSLKNLQHHSMYSQEYDVLVELHWTIAPIWNNIQIDFDSLLSAAVTVDIDGVELRVPGHDDRLLFLCLELEKESWSSLKRLMDFSALVSMLAGRDIERAGAAVRQAGKLRLLAVSLHVAADLGLLSVPDELAAIVGSDATARRIGKLAGERILRGPLPLWKRIYKELLLARKHDRVGAQLLHLWRVSVLWRLSKAVRAGSRRAAKRSRSEHGL
jgi:hypothetical protein